jgi:hypothetical protein
MKIHLNSIQKNKNLIKYILIGILNTIFAYISGVVFFNLFYKEIGAFLLTLLATIVNIFFTFINYLLFTKSKTYTTCANNSIKRGANDFCGVRQSKRLIL